jgi:adenosylmethionine-8-amino-7-oxononanoate aminotransferase
MSQWIELDLAHNWHPCAQMKDFETFPPLVIRKAQGIYLELEGGRRVLDAISSWWCKSLGHGHPLLKQALLDQLEGFEHVMFGQTTYEHIARLSQKLTSLTPHLDRVFYACDGSSAVEIALKMSLHARQIQGQVRRTQFMGLENAYHGETALAMSVSDLGVYREPYTAILQNYPVLRNIPYVSNECDPLWSDCSSFWPEIERQLEVHRDTLSAIIVEPIVQGAAGMRVYSKDFLKRLRDWTQQAGIHLIADEIMTGFYRTGPALACEHAGIEADFVCLGKGLTGGVLPLSAVMTSNTIYALFYDDYATGKSFLHSHTHSGNALAVSVALVACEVMAQLHQSQVLPALAKQLALEMYDLAETTHHLTAVRHIGAVVAADLINPQQIPRLGRRVAMAGIAEGILLRPIGQALYWLPPLNMTPVEVTEMRLCTERALSVV